MAIISADSSGIVKHNSDIWFIAMKKTNSQKHTGIHINREFQDRIKIRLRDNWVEKLSAILYYRVVNTLYQECDCVQIDKDFLGQRANYVRRYIEILFLVFRRSSPSILFLSEKNSRHIKEAHIKTKAARYKVIQVNHNPKIDDEIDCLKSYKIK